MRQATQKLPRSSPWVLEEQSNVRTVPVYIQLESAKAVRTPRGENFFSKYCSMSFNNLDDSGPLRIDGPAEPVFVPFEIQRVLADLIAERCFRNNLILPLSHGNVDPDSPLAEVLRRDEYRRNLDYLSPRVRNEVMCNTRDTQSRSDNELLLAEALRRDKARLPLGQTW